MKKGKPTSKDILRVTGVSVFAIMLFIAGTMVINQFAFASATGKTTILPPTEPVLDEVAEAGQIEPKVINIDTNTKIIYDGTINGQAAEEEAVKKVLEEAAVKKAIELAAKMAYTPPLITVVEGNHYAEGVVNGKHLRYEGDEVIIPDSALPIEEAADAGARYFWDVCGESIDGAIVVMRYIDTPSTSIKKWLGDVYFDVDINDINLESWSDINFMINAKTGDIIDFSYSKGKPDESISFQENREWQQQEDIIELFTMTDNYKLAAILGVSPEQLEDYIKIATEYTQRHFKNSQITTVLLGGNMGTPENPVLTRGISIKQVRDENNDIKPVFDGIRLTVFDDNGCEAYVSYHPDGSFSISTQQNYIDIAPDYYDDIPGVG